MTRAQRLQRTALFFKTTGKDDLGKAYQKLPKPLLTGLSHLGVGGPRADVQMSPNEFRTAAHLETKLDKQLKLEDKGYSIIPIPSNFKSPVKNGLPYFGNTYGRDYAPTIYRVPTGKPPAPLDLDLTNHLRNDYRLVKDALKKNPLNPLYTNYAHLFNMVNLARTSLFAGPQGRGKDVKRYPLIRLPEVQDYRGGKSSIPEHTVIEGQGRSFSPHL